MYIVKVIRNGQCISTSVFQTLAEANAAATVLARYIARYIAHSVTKIYVGHESEHLMLPIPVYQIIPKSKTVKTVNACSTQRHCNLRIAMRHSRSLKIPR